MKERYINESLYDKNFYRDISIYKIKANPLTGIGVIGMAICLYAGISGLATDSASKTAWMAMLLGLILLPLVTFLIPFVTYAVGYNQIVKDEHFKDLTYSTEITATSLHCKDTRGQSFFLQYKDVTTLDKQREMVVVGVNRTQFLYLKNDGFKGCTPDEAFEFIRKRVTIENPDSIALKR